MAITSLNSTFYYPNSSIRRIEVTKAGWSQKPRTDVPLAYAATYARYRIVSNIGDAFDYQNLLHSDGYIRLINLKSSPTGDLLADQAYNKAYAEFMELVRTGADIGTTLAEGRESLNMVATRLTSLWRAFRALKRGRFRDFLRQLNVRPKKRHLHTKWSRPKDASALWLEYWFGWSPTIQTVYDAIEVIESANPSCKVRATGTMRSSKTTTRATRAEGETDSYRIRVSWLVQAQVSVSDPVLYKANQLGLVNPAAVAWELVPFSFLVDWFVNVGDWLNGLTDFVGLSFQKSFRTLYCKVEGSMNCFDVRYAVKHFHSALYNATVVRRLPGAIPGPSLARKHIRGLSNTRAATAIALVISIFSKG